MLSQFPSTHFSLVQQNGKPRSGRALNDLLSHYRDALHVRLVRVWRLPPDVADDLLHDFLTAKFLEGNIASNFDPQKGRFRSLVLTSLDNFVRSALRKRHAQKRKAVTADAVPQDLLEDIATAQVQSESFDSQWALDLVRRVFEAVRLESQQKGQSHYWELYRRRVLDPALNGAPAPEYTSMIGELGFDSATTAANVLQTMRRRVMRVLEDVVGEYELPQERIEEEIRDLRRILSRTRTSDTQRTPATADLKRISECMIRDDRNIGWTPGELASLWQEQLRESLTSALSDIPHVHHAELSELLSEHASWTVGDLLQHTDPPLRLIRCLMDIAKAHRSNDCADIPSMISTALYFVLNAVAQNSHDEQLSSLQTHELTAAMEWLVGQSWVDEHSLALAKRAMSQ